MHLLEHAAADLSRAIAQGVYDDVEALVARYRGCFDERLRTLQPASPEFAGLCRSSRTFLGWALHCAKAGNAHDAARLRDLIRTSVYSRPPESERHTLNFEA